MSQIRRCGISTSANLVWQWVADQCDLNVLPSMLSSLSKDGFEIWQVRELNTSFDGSPHSFLVIARKLL